MHPFKWHNLLHFKTLAVHHFTRPSCLLILFSFFYHFIYPLVFLLFFVNTSFISLQKYGSPYLAVYPNKGMTNNAWSLTCAQLVMHTIAHEGCTESWKKSAVKVDWEKKKRIPCRTGESNLLRGVPVRHSTDMDIPVPEALKHHLKKQQLEVPLLRIPQEHPFKMPEMRYFKRPDVHRSHTIVRCLNSPTKQ